MNRQRFIVIVLLVSLAISSGLNVFRTSAGLPLAPALNRVQGVSVPAEYDNNAPTQQVGFSAADYSAGEADGTAIITVTLDTASSQTVTVDYATSDNTAIAGTDYLTVSGVLTFASGITSQTFAVSILDDIQEESDETITLTLSNPTNGELRIPNSATLTILDDDNYTYVPLVSRRWPPIPYTPVLNPIANPDGDGNYTVDWDSAELAESYTLAEATNPDFTDATVVYQGTGTSYAVSDRPAGAYYYRVKASNAWGESGWSNVQSVTVLPPPDAPVLNAISNPDGDGNYTVTWNATDRAQTYTLEEDDSAAFSSPDTVYSGPDTSKAINNKTVGTYYYRVKASNASGSSGWSNVQSVVVTVQPSGPEPGHYTGTTPSVSFDVTSDQQVCSFDIRVPFGIGSCRIRPSSCADITDNDFTFSQAELGAIYEISGMFDTQTHALGSYRVSMCGNTIIFPASKGTWEASK